MIKKLLFIAIIILSSTVFSQTRIKSMFYNLTNFGASSTKTSAIAVIDDFKPDLLMVAELTSNDAAINFMNKVLTKNTVGLTFSRPTVYNENSSGVGTYEQFVFFNNQKLEFISQTVYQTTHRDINRFTFKIITSELITTPTFLEVFVAHLAPSYGSTERLTRYNMVNVFTNALATLPTNSYVLFAGDFNLYSSNEPAYAKAIDVNNAIIMKDPINRPCDYIDVTYNDTSFWGQGFPYIPRADIKYFWQDNPDFADIHTQNPKSELDDRFDFILTSENLLNSNATVSYVPNSYKTYGNNNGECFNKSIVDVTCQSNITYTQSIRDALVTFSDHLPIVMEMETKSPSLSLTNYIENTISFASSNVVSSWLTLSITDEARNSDLIIYNQLGQIVKTIAINSQTLSNNELSVDLSNLNTGVYFINLKNNKLIRPLKFIKN